MSKLKPCPLCGGEVKLDADDVYMFCCDKCGAGITFAKVFEDGTAGDCSEDESVTAWNRRAQPVACEIAEYAEDCKDCGFCAQPANEPLTLEELREMHGEPVWIVPHRGIAKWYLVDVANECCSTCDMDVVDFELYGPKNTSYGWLAYRTKPEMPERAEK